MINFFRNNYLLRGIFICLYLLVYLSFQAENCKQLPHNNNLSIQSPLEKPVDGEEEKEFSTFEDEIVLLASNHIDFLHEIVLFHSKIKVMSKLTEGFTHLWSPPPCN